MVDLQRIGQHQIPFEAGYKAAPENSYINAPVDSDRSQKFSAVDSAENFIRPYLTLNGAVSRLAAG